MEALSATSFAADHPLSAVVDGSPKTFWMSTGLFPQQVVLRMAAKASVASVTLVCANVKRVVIERTEGATPGGWAVFDEAELPDSDGKQEYTFKHASGAAMGATFLRVRVVSGYADFVAVYSVAFK